MHEHVNLSNRLFEVIAGCVTPLKCWGFYLLSDEFKHEKELINKVGTIWLCSIFDTSDLSNRELDNIAKEAKKFDFLDIV